MQKQRVLLDVEIGGISDKFRVVDFVIDVSCEAIRISFRKGRVVLFEGFMESDVSTNQRTLRSSTISDPKA